MPWDFTVYIGVADAIVPATFTSLADEGHVRSVVSRAYYGCYHEALQYVLEQKWITLVGKQKARHGDVWRKFHEDQRIQEEIDIGDIGGRLCDDRREADYEMRFSSADKVCKSAIKRAKDIVALVAAARTIRAAGNPTFVVRPPIRGVKKP